MDRPRRELDFPGWPSFSEEEGDAVRNVLLSNQVNYWTGEEGRKFEEEFASAVAAHHAVAVANGTVALDLALIALGIGPGDEVIVTPRSFFASAGCIVNAGARPVFADVDADSQNITAETIDAVITNKTKAILCVHLAGWPCEMTDILSLARPRGIRIIEDCAQAHGAEYRGRPVGSFGDVSAWSFCQDKIMTTGGEGGMVVTDDERLWRVIWSYKDHGKSHDAVYRRTHPLGFRWLHESFGTNWRLTEMQSAIGRIQLGRLDKWVSSRRRNAAMLIEGLRDVPGLRLTVPPPHVGHSYYKFYVFVELDQLGPGWDRQRIMETIAGEGVPCFSGCCPEIYLEKAFRDAHLGPAKRLNVARQLGDTSLMFLVHPTLSGEHMTRIVSVVRSVMKAAMDQG